MHGEINTESSGLNLHFCRFGHYFDEALLCQSIIIIVAMFFMLELCIRMNRLRAESQGITLEEVTFFGILFTFVVQVSMIFVILKMLDGFIIMFQIFNGLIFGNGRIFIHILKQRYY